MSIRQLQLIQNRVLTKTNKVDHITLLTPQIFALTPCVLNN